MTDSTTTETAAVAEQGVNVAPEKVPSKNVASHKKDAPKAQETAAVAEQGADVAPERTPSKKGASQKKGAPKGQKTAKAAKPKSPKKERKPQPAGEKPVAREGTARAKVIAMISRKGGTTLDAIMKETGWQAHTCRGFISLLGSKSGMKIESTKREDGARVYTLAK